MSPFFPFCSTCSPHPWPSPLPPSLPPSPSPGSRTPAHSHQAAHTARCIAGGNMRMMTRTPSGRTSSGKQASKREGVTCEQIPVSRRLKSKIWLWASCATNVDFVLLPRHVKFYFNMLANGIKLISVRPVLFLKRDELSPVQYSSPVRVVIRFICCCMFTKVVKVATRS